ncbi:hypothetical protein JCM19238_3585 [Vibrio ponticus]|nr:hypothetical protein JCM19238_3585 [Vibrio ponticus]
MSLALIGIGVGFLLQVEMLSATFCLVPVIAAATQSQADAFRQVVERRFITQVGGCALAFIFTLVLSGHQTNIGLYVILLGSLIFLLASMMAKADFKLRDLHGDALLATMLPIQLYIGANEMGLERTFCAAGNWRSRSGFYLRSTNSPPNVKYGHKKGFAIAKPFSFVTRSN